MDKKFSIILLFVMLGIVSVMAQSSRRVQRIDREVQKTVFIPRGSWMVGGAVSYSEHNESNLNFLVLKDVEGEGYNFSVSPYVGYFFRDNIAIGGRFAYKRDQLTWNSAVRNVYSNNHSPNYKSKGRCRCRQHFNSVKLHVLFRADI